MKGYGVSNEKKAREEGEYGLPRKDNKSKGGDQSLKIGLCNEEKSDSYKGLAIVDGDCEGSELIITEKINEDTSLDACKGPPTLEVGKNQADEISPKSENYGSESNRDCATEIEEPEDENTDEYPPLGM